MACGKRNTEKSVVPTVYRAPSAVYCIETFFKIFRLPNNFTFAAIFEGSSLENGCNRDKRYFFSNT